MLVVADLILGQVKFFLVEVRDVHFRISNRIANDSE